MSQRDQKEENELMFTREVICQMIERAYLDATGKTDGFMRNHTGNVATKHQDDAIHFLKSKGFEQLCDAIGISHAQIRDKAFTTQREGRKQRQLP
jgi:hypothetical protein